MKSSAIFEEKYKNLNLKQKEAVDTIYGPVMVVAGPGTGKTTVLTLRIANILLKTDAKPEEILALTFTDSGAKAMREKLREVIGDSAFRVNIFTFHGFANHIIALYPEYFSKIGGRLPSTQADAIEIVDEIVRKNSFREIRIGGSFGLKVKDIVKRISELKREVISKEQILKNLKNEEVELKAFKEDLKKETKTALSEIERKEKYIRRMYEFVDVWTLYEKTLEEKGFYDFDDTILELIDALKKHNDLLGDIRESFQFILADEHQDANGAQNEILKSFGIGEEIIDPPNLFVVGDDKQSIFRFQGASLQNFYEFNSLFPNAKRIDLEENYRSHGGILELAHGFISHDGLPHTKILPNASFEIRPIEVLEYPDFSSEVIGVAKKIEETLSKNKEKDTVAVIARTNSALFEIASALEDLKIDYSLSGEKSLFESFEFFKIRSLFEALCNPTNEEKFLKALHFGFFHIPLSDIFLVREFAKAKRTSVGSVVLNNSFLSLDLEDKEAFKNFAKEFSVISREANKLPLLEFLKNIAPRIVSLSLNKSEAHDVFREIIDEATKFVTKLRHATLEDFNNHLSLLILHDIPPLINLKEKNSRVSLMSIHKSKGLEYDHVFIIDVTDRKFEKNSKKADLLKIPGLTNEKDLDEERRLLYVAITRAKRHATLSYALSGKNDEASAPSILLDELSEKFSKRLKGEVFEGKDFLSTSSVGKMTPDHKTLFREEFLKRSFSVTALNNFLDCPWKYFFRNLLLLPDVSEFNAMLGTACHEALRRFHLEERKGKVTKESLKKIIHEEVEHQAFSKRDLPIALEKALDYVCAYRENFSPFGESKAFIEEKVTFPFEVKTEKESFEVNITGKIDLAIEDGGSVHVKDFKTKKRMTRNEIMGLTKSSDGSYIRQLKFYKFLWENGGREGKVLNGSLVFLVPERGEILCETFILEEADRGLIEELVKEVLLKIFDLSFWNEKCLEKNCEFCQLSEEFKKNI